MIGISERGKLGTKRPLQAYDAVDGNTCKRQALFYTVAAKSSSENAEYLKMSGYDTSVVSIVEYISED